MKFYRAAPVNTIPACRGRTGTGGADLAAGLAGAAPLMAIRVADLAAAGPAGPGRGDRTALVVAGTPEIRSGKQLLFVKVVAVAPAVVRRDGRIQAGGHPAGHARLGALEQQLDELAGSRVIDDIAAQATLTGKVKGEAKRAMTAALTIRATVLMSVMPDADYREVMAALLGDLVLVPWQRRYEVPTGKVLSTWREALGPVALIRLQHAVLAGAGVGHLTGGGGPWCLKVHVIEYDVDVDGQDTGEMFCLITDLLDHAVYPAGQLAAAYAWRWNGPETSLKEAKSAITGAGPSTGPIFRSATPELITQEHAAWICGTELIRALARAAARRAALASIRSGAATASLPAPMTQAFHRGTLRALGKRRIVIDRGRHRDRRTQSPPGLPRRRTRHHHPHRDRPGQHLPASSSLTPPLRKLPPSPDPARTPPDAEPAARPERQPASRPAYHAPQSKSQTVMLHRMLSRTPIMLKSMALGHGRSSHQTQALI